ncbi:MAG: YcjF family protein [Acholeplasmataceae bacterium]
MGKKDSTKWIWYFISFGVIILFLLILLSSVLSVGERLRNLSEYVEYVFYGFTVILTYILILRPVHIILFSPAFSIETTLDGRSRKNYAIYKKVARRLINDGQLPQAEIENLKIAIGDYDELKVVLNHVYNKHIKKQMNQIIKKHAKTVMLSTAISQNGRLDFFTVVVVNLRMIKELVVLGGFRPSFKNLAKLTINVFTTALIAEGLENMNLNDLLPTSTVNTLGEIPLVKPVVSSVVQGIGNALLTLRIGVVTRKYLFTDAKEVTKEEIRRTALLEAAGMTPSVVGDGLAMLPRSIFNLFKKKESKEKVEDDE